MNILAAFIFFTRLPFWRIREVPAECFKHVVPYWPLSGWLTGGIMAGVLKEVYRITDRKHILRLTFWYILLWPCFLLLSVRKAGS